MKLFHCSLFQFVTLCMLFIFISSISQTCLTNANCPSNSFCGSNNYCICNSNFINYACDIQASAAQSPPNFTILSTTTSYFYIQPPDAKINTYLYYQITICSLSATSYQSILNIESYADLGTNNFLTDGPINSLNISFQNANQCVTLQTPLIMFSYQPNGESQKLVFAIIDLTSSISPSQNIISINTHFNQIVQQGVLKIIGYVLIGVGSVSLIVGIIFYCKRRRAIREIQMLSTDRKTVRLSPQQRIMHFDKYMPPSTYLQYLDRNNQIINSQNPTLNNEKSQFTDKLDKIQKKAIQMSILNANKTIQTQTNQKQQKRQYKKIECCVCLTELTKTDLIRQTICHHVFHKQCIDQWCKKSDAISCPMCRTQLDYDNVKKLLSQRGQNYQSQMSQYINQTSKRFQMKRSLLQ